MKGAMALHHQFELNMMGAQINIWHEMVSTISIETQKNNREALCCVFDGEEARMILLTRGPSHYPEAIDEGLC